MIIAVGPSAACPRPQRLGTQKEGGQKSPRGVLADPLGLLNLPLLLHCAQFAPFFSSLQTVDPFLASNRAQKTHFKNSAKRICKILCSLEKRFLITISPPLWFGFRGFLVVSRGLKILNRK